MSHGYQIQFANWNVEDAANSVLPSRQKPKAAASASQHPYYAAYGAPQSAAYYGGAYLSGQTNYYGQPEYKRVLQPPPAVFTHPGIEQVYSSEEEDGDEEDGKFP